MKRREQVQRGTRNAGRSSGKKKTRSRTGKANAKLIASKVLIESVPSGKALSHHEKRAATAILAGTPDGELPDLSRKQAESIAERPHVRDALIEALGKVGVNVDALAKVIAEGLSAHETKFFAHEGVVGDERDVVDHGIRHRFLETTLKVVGASPREGSQGSQMPSVNLTFRSFLGGKPVDVQIGDPKEEIVRRRMKAAKVTNRS